MFFLAQSAFSSYTNINPVPRAENLQKMYEGVGAFY